jgi:hypothetical protein
MDGAEQPDAGRLRLVIMTGTFGQLELCLVKGYNDSFRVGLINSPLAGLRPVAKHTRALVAYVVVLGVPLTHSYLIVFIQLSE